MVFRALSPELWGLGMDKGRTMPPLKFHDEIKKGALLAKRSGA